MDDVKSKCQSQAEVDYIGSAVVMQENYDNLRSHHALLINQACRMARLLKIIADDSDSKHSAEAAAMINAFDEYISF